MSLFVSLAESTCIYLNNAESTCSQCQISFIEIELKALGPCVKFYIFQQFATLVYVVVQNLDSEAPAVIENYRPEGSWPKEGAIQFNNVQMRYRVGLPLVLKGISLDIKAQEKIGIVGRTGSGMFMCSLQ